MKAHRTDTVSLVFGLLFVVVASGFLLNSFLKIQLPEVGWFVAGGLIIVGVVTAIGALFPNRQDPPETTDPAPHP